MAEVVWSLDLPSVQQAQELAEVGEREAERIARARQDEQRERVAESADAAEVQAWMARLRGGPLPDVGEVLTRGRDDPGDHDRQRRQRAREILRQYDLEDVLGGGGGTVLDFHLGVVESPGRGVAQRSAEDAEDAELARHLKQNAEDRRYIERFRRSRPPFARRSTATRSESCQHCTDQGIDDDTSYLLHSDPELNVPVTPPGSQAAQAETNRQKAEAERLMALGYSWETAHIAAIPYGEAVR